MADKYRRVEKPKEKDDSINQSEIRVTTAGRIRIYIGYATAIFKEKNGTEVTLKAMGRAINKTVTIAEILKRQIAGLHQITSIDSTDITDVYEPLEEGLDRIETTRHVSSITIRLSTVALDVKAPGYQAPLSEEQMKQPITLRRGRGGRGGVRGRRGLRARSLRGFRRGGRGGFVRDEGAEPQAEEEEEEEVSSPPTRGRGRGGRGGRGRGRGGPRGAPRGGRGGFRSEGQEEEGREQFERTPFRGGRRGPRGAPRGGRGGFRSEGQEGEGREQFERSPYRGGRGGPRGSPRGAPRGGPRGAPREDAQQ